MGQFLVRMIPLSADQQRITRLRERDEFGDRFGTVRLKVVVDMAGVLESLRQSAADLVHAFQARIIARQDYVIAVSSGNSAEVESLESCRFFCCSKRQENPS